MKIKKPYRIAFINPFDRFSLPFVKKLTVNGIIGNTHGVNKANNPPINPKPNIDHKPLLSSGAGLPQS